MSPDNSTIPFLDAMSVGFVVEHDFSCTYLPIESDLPEDSCRSMQFFRGTDIVFPKQAGYCFFSDFITEEKEEIVLVIPFVGT